MNHLTEDFWYGFKKVDGRYDGNRFEELVAFLLPYLEELNWIQTGGSWDRSRDFEVRANGKYIWAECKMHNSKLSIRAISPTLVMAIIDDADTIFFFSYSKLNTNAYKHLSQFQKETKKQIRVFDDQKLEDLILKNAKCLNEFFPDFTGIETIVGKSLEVSAFFSKDPEVEYVDHRNLSETVNTLDNGWVMKFSTFCVDIFLKNLNPFNSSKGAIRLLLDNGHTHLALIDKEIRDNDLTLSFDLIGAGVFYHRYYFKAIENGNNLKLPQFSVTTTHKSMELLVTPEPSNIDISSILSTPLIGKNALGNLKRFKRLIRYRHKALFLHVYGASGTGKSRLLMEFREGIYDYGLRLIALDAESSGVFTFNDFIRKFLCRLYRLPIFEGEGSSELGNINTAQEQSEIKLMNLVYDPSFYADDYIEDCLNLAIAALCKEKVAVVIDNFQNLDDNSVHFAEALIARLTDVACQSMLIFSVNTDLLFNGTKSNNLNERLLTQSLDHQGQFHSFEVKEFSPQDVSLYIDHCLVDNHYGLDTPASFTAGLSESIRLFTKKVIPRPLFIEQTLLLFEDQGVLRRSSDRFFITNPELFHQLLDEIPASIKLLLKKRWDLVQKKVGEAAIGLIKMLSMLGSLPTHYLLREGFKVEVLRKLEYAGFLRLNEEGICSFYHLQLFKFFRSLYDIIPTELAVKVCQFLQKNSLVDKYFYQYFIAAEISNTLTNSIIVSAAKRMRQKAPYNDFLLSFAYAFNRVVLNNNWDVAVAAKIRALKQSGILIKLYDGYLRGTRVFKSIFQKFSEDFDSISSEGEAYFDFVHEYANSCIAVYEDLEALELLRSSLANISQLDFASEVNKGLKEAFALNRECVIFKSISLNEEALEVGERSLKIAERLQNPELQIQNHIDISNVYGRSIKHSEIIERHWESAIRIFNENKTQASVSKWRSMVQLYNTQYLLLNNNVKEASQLIEDNLKYCKATFDHFFGVKFLFVKILLAFIAPGDINSDYLLKIIESAYDRCLRYRVNRSYWKVFWFEAIYHRRSGNNKRCVSLYLETFSQFLEIAKHPGIEDYHSGFLEEVSLYLLANKHLITQRQFSLFKEGMNSLKNMRIKRNINEILRLSPMECNHRIENHTPIEFFNNGKFDYPKIG